MLAAALLIAALQGKEKPLPEDSLYRLKTKTLEGKDAELKEHSGKVALVVNLASQ
jgi:hypothetical protein